METCLDPPLRYTRAPVPCVSGQDNRPQVKASKLSTSLTQNSDELFVLQKLSLNADTLCRDNNPLLFLLSINSWSGSVEGSGHEQMTPKLENKAFSASSTKYIGLKHHKQPYNAELETHK